MSVYKLNANFICLIYIDKTLALHSAKITFLPSTSQKALFNNLTLNFNILF